LGNLWRFHESDCVINYLTCPIFGVH
jgi:hypothetical protein